ncbi:flp pilus-assembly TadE/G-like family protein [Nocardia sp. NEAU-G5]|uniref:Flp pilus-assembly TadE/G-like family protein n=2 Tax=Nocardiaceae TaxID=85025 RepID=A0ABS6ARB8_9NOCA|nr:flp pilus-assembly TadE/G-like family protein [Nocardia albiluteola]
MGWRDERGAATVAACLALTALLAVTVLIGQVGAVIVARHRAQAAADLGALAAAGALSTGSGDACAQARDIGRRMGARVPACTVADWDVTVVAEITASFGPFGRRAVGATARAGPGDTRTDD